MKRKGCVLRQRSNAQCQQCAERYGGENTVLRKDPQKRLIRIQKVGENFSPRSFIPSNVQSKDLKGGKALARGGRK